MSVAEEGYQHELAYQKPSHSPYVIDTKNILTGLLAFIGRQRQEFQSILTILQAPEIQWLNDKNQTRIIFRTKEPLSPSERRYISQYAFAAQEQYNLSNEHTTEADPLWKKDLLRDHSHDRLTTVMWYAWKKGKSEEMPHNQTSPQLIFDGQGQKYARQVALALALGVGRAGPTIHLPKHNSSPKISAWLS